MEYVRLLYIIKQVLHAECVSVIIKLHVYTVIVLNAFWWENAVVLLTVNFWLQSNYPTQCGQRNTDTENANELITN